MAFVRLAVSLALLSLCACKQQQDTTEAINLQDVILPGGAVIKAELMTRRDDLARGMMHRESLPEDRGLLFAFGKPEKHRFWMLNVRVPLDIIFLDRSRAIVRIDANATPCPALPCRSYGNDIDSQFVLELAGGVAAKHGLAPGQTIRF